MRKKEILKNNTRLHEELIKAKSKLYQLQKDLGERNSSYLEEAEDERLQAADEVCWTLVTMMHLDILDIEQEQRNILAGPLQKWMDLAVKTNEWLKENK